MIRVGEDVSSPTPAYRWGGVRPDILAALPLCARRTEHASSPCGPLCFAWAGRPLSGGGERHGHRLAQQDYGQVTVRLVVWRHEGSVRRQTALKAASASLAPLHLTGRKFLRMRLIGTDPCSGIASWQ